MTSPASARPTAHPDADIAEIEPCDLASLARGLGPENLTLLESTLRSDAWGEWSLLAPEPHRHVTFSATQGWWDEALMRCGTAMMADTRPRDWRSRSERVGPWARLEAEWRELAEPLDPPPSDPGRIDRGCPVPPFRGGLVVAISYDAARALPDFPSWPDGPADDTWPWFDVRTVGELVARHEASGRTFLVVSRHPALGPAEPRLERIRSTIESARRGEGRARYDEQSREVRAMLRHIAPTPSRGSSVKSNMSDAEFASAFERLQDYLRAGDLYQANLTRRFEARCELDASMLYARLRDAAPAPYSAWLAGDGRDVLSASPELFLARMGDRLVTRPIKGTRPRRLDPAADAEEARALTASAKDRAEHVMIVDVHRNDLGRVCEYGSVRVETLAGLEAFPTVHHLTSTIVGTPRAGLTPWQAIAAAFPAGSITGAPKRRAIEVIEELEPTRRALYCGSIGWIGFDGDFALNVAIRTILLSGGTATFQAGGGIVIDSECAAEAEETWNKARALYAAIAPEAESASASDATPGSAS